MIGGGFMGKAHALAYAAMPMFFWPAPAIPRRKVIVDVTPGLAETARQLLGGFRGGFDGLESGSLSQRYRRRRYRDAEVRQSC